MQYNTIMLWKIHTYLLVSTLSFVLTHADMVNSCGFQFDKCTDIHEAKTHKKYFTGSGICSHNSKFQMGITWDGDLCICKNKRLKTWCAGIDIENKNEHKAFMVMQGDGNFVVYDVNTSRGVVLWSSRTHKNKGARLRLKNGGIAVISNTPSQTLWSSGDISIPTLSPVPLPTLHPSLMSSPTNPEKDEFTMYIVGDTPYSSKDLDILQSRIASLPSDADALVHVGDIKGGRGQECPLSKYAIVSQELVKSHAPVFIVPGDNDANDCPSFEEGWNHWSRTFLSPNPFTESHWDVSKFGDIYRKEGTADFAFVHKQILVLGVDIVGGKPHSRDEWDERHIQIIVWAMDHIENYATRQNQRSKPITILILGHGRPQINNKDFFVSLYSKMTKVPKLNMDRVLYIHGDGHKAMSHIKYGFSCVQVDIGRRQWLKLSLSANDVIPMTYSHGVFIE